MSTLQTIENTVLSILEENPKARSDDYILMVCVCEKVCPELMNYPFWLVMENHYENNLPNWESVTRCRRKIQEKRPDLVAPKTAKNRHKKEKKYREYAHT